jgi:hypothetical protein
MLVYELTREPTEDQSFESVSHIGGYPNVPVGIDLPKCQLCDSRMTFFFQLKLPKKHQWQDRIIALFSCTSCSSKNIIIPVSPNFQKIPDFFLDQYEKNFKIFVIEPAEELMIRKDYTPILRYEKLNLERPKGKYYSAKLGGKPNWRISDDFPRDYMGSSFTFLLQMSDWEFEKYDNAPKQVEHPWFTFSTGFREDGKYSLFSGVPLYFFGTLDLEQPKVYVLNQK